MRVQIPAFRFSNRDRPRGGLNLGSEICCVKAGLVGYLAFMTRNKQQAEARRIDWGSAEIQDGELTVELVGDAVKGWVKDFKVVLALLEHNSHTWGTISLVKGTIKVAGVRDGSEGALRHFLESVVLQVNSDLDLHCEVADRQDERAGSGERQRSAEREMAATFRSFAELDA
jgi:hypothetical protein